MWKSLITEILRSGMTQKDVASALGISQASVSDIYRGVVTDPKVSIADALRTLHAERFPDISPVAVAAVSMTSSPVVEPPATDDLGSGDPRHGERRQPEKRARIDRRKEEV